MDIVNCHHPRYYADLYRDKKRTSPQVTETEDPVPVYFVVVDEGSTFRFRIGSRSATLAHVEQGLRWLTEGLGLLGIGAKTATGYGAMKPVSAPDQARREQGKRGTKG